MTFLSKLSPVPSFPSYTGPYKVGTMTVEIASSSLPFTPSSTYSEEQSQSQHATSIQQYSNLPPSIAFRIFYPCQSPTDRTKTYKPVYWVQEPQKRMLDAYARFLGVSEGIAKVFSQVIPFFPFHDLGAGYCCRVCSIKEYLLTNRRGLNRYIPQLINFTKVPVHGDADPLPPDKAKEGKWPVVIFSHGLGGTVNSYSHLLGSLASHGLIVLAIAHRDGSAPISFVHSKKPDGEVTEEEIGYESIPHNASPQNLARRDNQLKIRLFELGMAYEALRRIDKGEGIDNLDPEAASNGQDSTIFRSFKDNLDLSHLGRVTWAGHSFGSATVVAFLKSIFYHAETKSPLLSFNPSAELKAQITSSSPTILLDPWTMPLQSPGYAPLAPQSLPQLTPPSLQSAKWSPNIISILSQSFYNWTSNLENTKRLLRPSSSVPPFRQTLSRDERSETLEKEKEEEPPLLFYTPQTAHLSQSDFGILFPRMARYLAKARADPVRTLDLNVRAILEVLRRSGILPVKREEGEGGSDDEILSKQGKVNGWEWVSVLESGGDYYNMDEKQEEPKKKVEEKSFGDDEVASIPPPAPSIEEPKTEAGNP